MKAVYASTVNHDDPLAALAVGEQPEPQARPFWSTVSVRAVTVNHHDVWSLQGVGSRRRTDADDPGHRCRGRSGRGHPPASMGSRLAAKWCCTRSSAPMARRGPGERRTILSEKYPGTMAEKTAVPSANVFAKPANLTTAEAAALGHPAG